MNERMDRLFDGLFNFYGPLSPDIKKRIKNYLCHPTVEGWVDIYGIIIRADIGLGLTVWQAVIAVDPAFPRVGRRTDFKGNVLREWQKIPDPFTLKKALEWAKSIKKEDIVGNI